MDQIIITKEMVQAARDYVPLAEKEAWVADNAVKCFDRMAITAGDEPMPPMYMINGGLKRRYLMAALAGLYFGRPLEHDDADEKLMAYDEYDAWAGSHVLNQLERLKSDKEVRDKCFDLLYDYHELEKMFSTAVTGFLTIQNDFVTRQAQYTAAQVQELPQVLEQLKAYQDAKKGEENE